MYIRKSFFPKKISQSISSFRMNWGEDVEKDEPMDISIGNEHTLYTGGCDGVDVCAEDMARSMGFQVHVKIGPSH